MKTKAKAKRNPKAIAKNPGRRKNLSTGAIVALAITGAVVVPVVLIAVGVGLVARKVDQEAKKIEAQMDLAQDRQCPPGWVEGPTGGVCIPG